MTEPWEGALDDIIDFCPCCDDHLEIVTEGIIADCATLRSTIEGLTAERDKALSDLGWRDVTIEAMHLQQCPVAIVPPDECRAKSDALCATRPEEEE